LFCAIHTKHLYDITTYIKLHMNYNYGNNVTKVFGLFVIVAFIGWAVSTFLSGIHFWGLPLPEGAEPSGSLEVITSEWAYVFGIPLAFLGSIYYLSVITAASMWFQTKHPLILKSLTVVTATGVVFSAFFVYLQIGIINEICPFCMISAAASTILFLLEIYMVKSSELPSFSELFADWNNAYTTTSIIQAVFIIATGMLVIGAFYGATLAPIPT